MKSAASPKVLSELESKVTELPLLPQVLVRIMSLSVDQDDFFEQLDQLYVPTHD